jgi:hypothetical protein
VVEKWSERLCRQFDVVLPEDTARWYDQEVWRHAAATSYGDPIAPEAVLDVSSHRIWGGLMLPDTLPILGNGFGDVLAMRFGFDGALTEFVEWHHEGGGWHPCGTTLVEALLYDAARTSFGDEGIEGTNEEDVFVFAEWAFRERWSAEPTGSFKEFVDHQRDDDHPIAALLAQGIAVTAVWRDLARTAVTNGLARSCRRMGGQSIAEAAGTTWEQLAEWLHDASSIPQEMKKRLAEVTGTSTDELVAQDVDGAAEASHAVLRIRKDLIWPHAVLGWAAEKQGRPEEATNLYMRGLEALGSTADFTELWVPLGPDRRSDFCLARLQALGKDRGDSTPRNAYLAAALIPPFQSVDCFPVRRYWMECAAKQQAAGEHREAYRAYYAAGWDFLMFDDMDRVLEGLMANAEAAGARALAKIAKCHLASLQSSQGNSAGNSVGQGVATPKRPWWRLW